MIEQKQIIMIVDDALIYGKMLFQGTMVDDSREHDIETADGKHISIKTRKGWNSAWTQKGHWRARLTEELDKQQNATKI